jgi:Ser/Thr protein kinase RdoA (MazF antagonist)
VVDAPWVTLEPVFAAFSIDAAAAAAQLQTAGTSGSKVWRVGDRAGNDWCVRSWRSDKPREKIDAIHQAMQLATADGCAFIPVLQRTQRGQTLWTHSLRLWEVSTWLPGRPAPCDNVDGGLAEGALTSLGRLHAALRSHHAARGQPRGLLDRLHTIEGWERSRDQSWSSGWTESVRAVKQRGGALADAIEAREDLTAMLASIGSLAAVCWERLQSTLPSALHRWLGQAMALQWTPRDVHREHVLFVDRQVSGIIDFGAGAVDWPGVDAARLLPEIASPNPDRWHRALLAYREATGQTLPLPCLQAIAWATHFIALDGWLRWWLDDSLIDLCQPPRAAPRLAALQRWFDFHASSPAIA